MDDGGKLPLMAQTPPDDTLQIAYEHNNPPLPPERPLEFSPQDAKNAFPSMWRNVNPIVKYNIGRQPGWAETYPPGEEGDPNNPNATRPAEFPLGRTGIEVYNPRNKGVDLGLELLHADPKAIETRNALLPTITKGQRDVLARGWEDYDESIREKLSEKKAMENVVDAMARTYLANKTGLPHHQGPQRAIDAMNLTNDQKKLLDNLYGYTQTGKYANGGEVSGSVDLAPQDEDIQNALRIAKEPVRYDTGPQPGEPVLSSYDPTIKERIYQTVAGAESRPSPERAGFARGVSQMAEFAPFLGNVMAGQEAYRRGDTKGMLMAAVPLPGAAKEGAAVREIEKEIAPLIKKSVEPKRMEYQGAHQSPGPESGAPLWRMHGIYPDDLYSPQGFRYYADFGNPYDMEGYQHAISALNQPSKSVIIYRAVPKDKNIKEINAGDWVTLTKDYAKEHGESHLGGNYKILKKSVKARDLFTSGDSIHEFGYHPQPYVSDSELVSKMSPEEARLKLSKLTEKARNSLRSALEERSRQERATGGKASGKMNDDTIQDALRIANSRLGRADGGKVSFVKFDDKSGTLGIPRDQMPQIKSENKGALVNFLNAKGIKHKKIEVDPDSLKPTQREFSPEKIKGVRENVSKDRTILVSKDGHVIDGHHQWLAAKEDGEKVKAIVFNKNVRDVLDTIKEFPSSTVDNASRVKRASGGEIPTPPRRPDDLEYYGVMADAQKKFPFINKYDPHIKVEPREGDGMYSEFYNAEETGNPNDPSDTRPAEFPYGSSGVRVYRPEKFTAADYAAEYLHGDPVANKTREELIKRLTPKQLEFIKGEGDYQESVKQHLPEERAVNNAVDAMMRGYVMQDEPSNQWPKEALAELEFTPEELELLNSLQDYVEAPAEAIYNKKLFDNPEEN